MNYEINEDTFALIPYSSTKTRVIEKEGEYIVSETPYAIMENSCRYFGSSMDGRIMGSKDMLGSIYKVPVIVEEIQKLIFFPTTAFSSPRVSFIAYKGIENVSKRGSKSLITFKTGKKVLVNCPFFSIKNQMFRCNVLESISNNRKIGKKTIK